VRRTDPADDRPTEDAATLARSTLPDFGMPGPSPSSPRPTGTGSERLRARPPSRGYDRLVVYADREHSANLAYLTGFDPRFEEAVLVLGPTATRLILVGNECFGMAGAAPLPMRRELFQDLSLPGQPRDRSGRSGDPRRRGVGTGSRVGVVGWKTYADRSLIEVPAFLVDELRAWSARPGLVENATDLLIDAADGLRVDQRGRAARRLRVRRLPDLPGGPPAAVRAASRA
jgi:hypothetical protein